MVVIVGAVSGSIILLLVILVFVLLKWKNTNQQRQQLPAVVKDVENQPYQNVNTGRDGYEIPRNLQLMEASPAPPGAYYAVIPDIAKYTNVNDGEIMPRQWDTVEYSTPDDPYTEIEVEGYINMRGLVGFDESL